MLSQRLGIVIRHRARFGIPLGQETWRRV